MATKFADIAKAPTGKSTKFRKMGRWSPQASLSIVAAPLDILNL